MIILTKEKREELIEKALLKREMLVDNGLNATLNEIALASLMADPSGYRWFHEGSSETCGWYADCFPLDNDYLEKCLADRSIHSYESLFTAPPVPDIKLPEMKEYTDPHSQYSEGVVDGYNRCLAEIKRLNGLKG